MTQKWAMVTGASGGIGLVLAQRLAKEGYRITAVARSREGLDKLIGELGAEHRAVVADLSKTQDIERVAAMLRSERHDLLVNNAGVGVYGAFQETPLEKLQAMTRLNCDAVVTLSHAFLAGAKEGDTLVNVASTLGLLAFPGAATYAATKAFVVSFSEGLWFENKDRGVFVMALCPGVTKTNFHTAAGGRDDNRPPENIAQSADQVADEAIKAIKGRGAPTVVTGIKNELMIWSTRLMTRKAMVNMMGSFSPERRNGGAAKAN